MLAAKDAPQSGPDVELVHEPAAIQPPAWQRRGMALLLPLLCIVSGALVPAAVDLYRLYTREPSLGMLKQLHAASFGFSLMSMVALPLGVVLALAVTTLVRTLDPGEACQRLLRVVGRTLVLGGPQAAAAWYSGFVGVGALVALQYKVALMALTSFKNQSLAALLLGCLTLVVFALVVVAALMLRVGLLRALGWLRGVPVLGRLASLGGAVALTSLAMVAGVTYLVVRFWPIVAIIDWRPLSYPSMGLAAGVAMLLLVLWFRGARLRRGVHAGLVRRLLLGGWAALILGSWTYCFLGLENNSTLRTALLRRAFGSAKAMDFISTALDFDGDGYLSFFGGGDCAPFNAAIHPGAPEIPDNGTDDNCYGGDLKLHKLHAPKRRFDAPLLPSVTKRGRLNFVLITLDGLRADHVGVYGYDKPTTPFIDAWAKQGVVFERAYTQAPATRYSIPSFMTSKYSSQVPRESTTNIPHPIRPEALLMAEVFKKAGYNTGAALSYQVFNRSWHMDQGFDFYDNSHASYYVGKGGPTWNMNQPYQLVTVAKKFLADQDRKQPFFLWVHFFEPHPPYVRRTKPHDFGRGMVPEYDGELRFADEKVGQLLDAIAKHPAADRTVVILGADHGRGLNEHGLATHGYDLYGENLHVPFVFRVPGTTPRRIRNPVALIDLLPTMVNLAGIRDKFEFEGQSLVPQLMHGTEPKPDRPIFSEVQVGFHNSHVINAITTRDYKLIYDVTYNTYQLFDLNKDPIEKHDLAAKLPHELSRMKRLLFHVMERATLPAMQEAIRGSIVAKAPNTPGVTQVNFANKIKFLGFEVRPERPRAGAIVNITWYIRALANMKTDYKSLVHLKGSRRAFFDAKHVPVNGQFPSSKWRKGQIIRDRQHLRLPHGPQDYEVWVGFGTGHEILKPVGPHKMLHTVVKVGSFKAY